MRKPLAGWLVAGLALLAATAGALAPAAGDPAAPGRPAAAPGDAPAVSGDPAVALPVDPAVSSGRFANGLTWYIRDNARPEKRAELWLAVNAGSALEDQDQKGLAHFVEHMCFDGTRRFPRQAIVKYLESIGMRFGPDLNAFTSFDETVYTIKVPTDQPEFVDKGIEILSEWAHAVSFEAQEFERERGVVIEEWRSRRGADARMRDLQLPIVLAGSRYADRLPIGTLDSLQHARREELARFYHDWYRPDLMAVIAVGDFGAYGRARLEKQLRDGFAGLANPSPERPRASFAVPAHDATRFAIATDSEATTSRAAIEVQQPRQSDLRVGDFRRKLIESLYHGMLNARLSEVAKRPDAPFQVAFSFAGSPVRPLESETATAVMRNGALLPGVQALLTEVERVHRHGFSAAELERQKAIRLRQLEKRLAESDKSESGQRAAEILQLFLESEPVPGEAFELALTRQLLGSIELAEVNRLAAGWSGEANRVIEIDAPAKPDVPVPSEAQLRQAFAAVQASTVAAWEDRTQEGPLVPHPPRPGTVVAETRIAELGMTEWRLDNGVRVVLKPTDFKNDEILLSGFGPGGMSLVPDAQVTSAELATTVVRAGGLGTFDDVTLRKALAGKSASASVSIAGFDQRVRGTASPRDVETMFQLLYLSFTAPRRDPDAYQSTHALLTTVLENRSAEPREVFNDAMQAALHPGDPRERPLTIERLRELDYDTAFRLYQERFADAGQFTFVLVGSFTPDTIRPLVLTWLGGLPSTASKQSWRPVGGPLPAGVVRVSTVQGKEPKSAVRLVFTGESRYSVDDAHQHTALLELLQLRLREVLRDDMGGVYGASVSGNLAFRPWGHYSVSIGFSCAPENVDSLTRAVFREIAAIKDQGVDAEHVAKLKAAARRTRETNVKENSFWSNILTVYYLSGWDPREILHFDARVEQTTSATLQAAARQYLVDNRYVLGVLSPAAAGAPAGAATKGSGM